MCGLSGHTYKSGYKNTYTKFNVTCNCGKEWLAPFTSIQRGSNCPEHCSYSEEDIAKICTKYGHTYVGGYLNTKVQFNCICSCGAPWLVYFSTINKGSSCDNCRGYTNDDVASILAEYSLMLLQPYKGSHIPVIYECSCGGIGKTLLSNIRRGDRCTHCAEMKWRAYFLDSRCEVINYVSAIKIEYKCFCGNSHTTIASSFRDNIKKCPKYKLEHRTPSRPSLFSWKKIILERDNFECQICSNDETLHVHHIEAYSYKPELADDINNGIVLCYDCHKGLHSMYGWNVGRKNLLEHKL